MIEVPGKIFILGEYAVMHGGEAVIAAIRPPFQCAIDSEKKFHEDSPAAKWLFKNQVESGMKISGGAGPGFGSSTAELIAANRMIPNPANTTELWSWYRENFFPASGADLAVQMESVHSGYGLYQFQITQSTHRLHPVHAPYLFLNQCLLFHCPPTQKIPTYSDLENRKQAIVENRIANGFVHRWMESFNPAILSEWADHLAHLGFESLFGSEVRKAFRSVEGVVGVKGCGAGLNDAFLVCVDQTNPHVTLKGICSVVERYSLIEMGKLYERI